VYIQAEAPHRRTETRTEDQAMFHNSKLAAGELRNVGFLTAFQEYCARADECQRLADRHPTLKQGYENLAQQWRELVTQGGYCQV
jgi:hypothetical protein